MLKHRSTLLFSAALTVALVSSGCLDSQKSAAKSTCGMSYVGRQKVACENGVEVAATKAARDDGRTATEKYHAAMAACHAYEKPLVKPCVTGVKNFRTEIARSDSKGQMTSEKPMLVAKHSKKKSKRGRAIASQGAAIPASSK